jgi:hypothetical protein
LSASWLAPTANANAGHILPGGRVSEQATSPRTRAEAFKALAFETPTLSYGAKSLWHVLYHYADAKTSEAFPGYRKIRKHLGCHVISIRGWLDELKAAGWIEFKVAPSMEHKRGYRHIYQILDGQGQPFFKVESVTENRTQLSQKTRTLKRKSKPSTSHQKTEHSVPENPNVTNTSPLRESVCSSDVGRSVGDQTTNPPSGAGMAPLGAPAALRATVKRHPAFVPGNCLDEEE